MANDQAANASDENGSVEVQCSGGEFAEMFPIGREQYLTVGE